MQPTSRCITASGVTEMHMPDYAGSDNVIRDVVAALGQWPEQLGAVGW